jgi:hypothetical protein
MQRLPPPENLLEDLAERLTELVGQYGFWKDGRLLWTMPVEVAIDALLPEMFCPPPSPDTAFTTPGGTPERFTELLERAEANRHLWHAADRDLEALERVAAMLKPGKGDKRNTRKHYQIVVETDHGPEATEFPGN